MYTYAPFAFTVLSSGADFHSGYNSFEVTAARYLSSEMYKKKKEKKKGLNFNERKKGLNFNERIKLYKIQNNLELTEAACYLNSIQITINE